MASQVFARAGLPIPFEEPLLALDLLGAFLCIQRESLLECVVLGGLQPSSTPHRRLLGVVDVLEGLVERESGIQVAAFCRRTRRPLVGHGDVGAAKRSFGGTMAFDGVLDSWMVRGL